MPGKVRRIVTGINSAGRSFIVSDSALPTADVGTGQPVNAGMWMTDRAPASNAENADPAPDGVTHTIGPADKGGTLFRILDIAPDAQRQLSADDGATGSHDEPRAPRKLP
jgi:hypothetical protein